MSDISRRTAVVVALAFGLGAAMIARAAYVRDPALHVSPAIGYVVGITLAAAALAALARAWSHPRALNGLAALLLVGMTVVGAYLATPAGARGCRGSFGALPGVAPSFGCRSAFGAGALITALMAALALRQWWTRDDGGAPPRDRR